MYQQNKFCMSQNNCNKHFWFYLLLQNLSGTIVAVISIISLAMGPNPRTAAIYYFITALFILLACFDTYFALPLNVSFLRAHTWQHLHKDWTFCDSPMPCPSRGTKGFRTVQIILDRYKLYFSELIFNFGLLQNYSNWMEPVQNDLDI